MAWHSEGAKQGLALRLQSSKAVSKPTASGTCFPLPCPPTTKPCSACGSLLLRKRLLICLKFSMCLSGGLNQGTPRDHQLFLKALSPLPDVWLINGRTCSIYPCSMRTGFWGSFTGGLWLWRPLAARQYLHSCLPHIPAQMWVPMHKPRAAHADSFMYLQLRAGLYVQTCTSDSHMPYCPLCLSILGAVSHYTKTL